MLVPCGTTGESVTLTEDEQNRVIAHHAGGGRRPRAGAGRRGQQRHARPRSRRRRPYAALGVHGILSVGPYYNKPTPEGFFRHFSAIADASTVPVVVYNVPGRTGSNIDAKTLLRLAAHPNITAVKEASGNLGQVMEILRDRPARLRGALGRRRVHARVHGPGRRGRHLGGGQPGPARRCTTWRRPARAGDFAEARRIHNRLLRS